MNSKTKDNKRPKRIGLFGGSFNPIHNAHVKLAHTICNVAALDEVWFLVTPQNPFKKDADNLAPEQQRYEMAKLTLRRFRKLRASDYEFTLPRPSYTWNTLQHLEKDYPDYTFYIIIGADNWQAFDRWAHHEDILGKYDIIIYPREGCDIDRQSLPENVMLVNTPKINITSTMIREMVKNGEKISEYVPKAVEQYIDRNALFA